MVVFNVSLTWFLLFSQCSPWWSFLLFPYLLYAIFSICEDSCLSPVKFLITLSPGIFSSPYFPLQFWLTIIMFIQRWIFQWSIFKLQICIHYVYIQVYAQTLWDVCMYVQVWKHIHMYINIYIYMQPLPFAYCISFPSFLISCIVAHVVF